MTISFFFKYELICNIIQTEMLIAMDMDVTKQAITISLHFFF